MKFRSIKDALKELKKIDNDTAISEYVIRKLANEEKVSQVISGKKIMVDVDSIINYLQGISFTPNIIKLDD